MSRYDRIKDLYDIFREIEKIVASHEPKNPERAMEIRKKYRTEIREELKKINRYYIDPLEKPLTDGWRHQIDEEYGEDGTDYRILPVENADDWTDEEIEDYIMSEVGYPPINSPYDCTGKRFTAWTSWKKQPAGIIMIHHWGLDV